MASLRFIGAALVLGCIPLVSSAAFVKVLAEPDVPGTVHPDVAAARSSFLGTLTNVVHEPFTQVADPGGCGVDGNGDPVPVSTAVGSIALDTSASYTCLGVVNGAAQGSDLGRFDTTGNSPPQDRKFLEWLHGFTLTFPGQDGVQAFGLYMTDINDFAESTQMCLTRTDGVEVCDTLGQRQPSGSVGFWGFSDPNNRYVSVSFLQTLDTQLTLDAVGFDDLFIGDVGTTQPGVPEPATLALLGLALAGAGVARRRK